MARRQMPKNEEEYKRYKEEREARGLASLDSPAETPYGAPTERANLRNPYSGFGNTSLTMPKNEEEYRRYRLRKAAERNNQKWDARSDLRNQRAELENAAPTATGNRDAEWAGYYAALRNYGAAYGDKASYDEGFAGYNAAMDRVRGQYDSHEARHAESDRKMDSFLTKSAGMQGAGNRMTDADRRFVRDTALYNRMGKDANTAGDYELYQRAAQGYNKTVSDHATNYGQAQSDYWNAAKTEQPGYYYAQTMSADEVDAKLEELRATREKLHENLMGVLSDIDNNPHTPEERQRLSDTKYRIQDRYTNINNEIDYLETAKGLHKQRRGDDMYNYWLNEGGLEKPENWAKVEQGKAKYEADQTKASGGVREPEIATPAGGAIKAYRNRNQKENEWDNIFDNAPNLTPSDEMVFYALYADDPEQAMEWAYYINNRRNSEFQGEMAAWGKEHPITAWFGGLGNRMISGVANIVDENSAFAQKQSLQSTGLMSGGAQALNEWSGTIDTDIPIIRDLFNGKGAGDFYQLASSIVESGINMAVASYTGDAAKLVGALGTFIMGSSAAAADYNESLQRGLTTAQAQRHALAAGINEAAFEFISLDKVIKADKLAGQLKKVFVDAGIEASEEFFTTVANRVADGYLARQDGYDTQIEQRTKELIALGLSRADAEAQAEKEWRVELINDAIGGFISGGFHAGIEWGGRKVANKIATNQYNETAGIMTDADEIAALRAYADENGIKYNEKALRGMEAVETEESGRQSAVPTETRDGGTDSSPTAQNDNQNNNEETAEKKRSRREARQERKSNRATGALQTQVEAHIAKAAHESGLNNAQAFFEQTVSRYGEGITRTAQNAIAHEARSVFGQASNQAELTELYQKAVDGVTAQPVKQALQKVYNEGTAYLYKQGDEGAKNRLIQQIGNTGKQFNTTVVLQNEDGTERSAKITDVLPGAERVKLDNGETVAVRDLAGIDADTKDILDMIGRLEIGSAADMLWKSFKVEAGNRTGSENSRYILDWTQAFDQGRTNEISMEEAVRRSSLDKATVEQAYTLGQQERVTMDKAKEERLAKAREQAKKGFTGKKGILDDTGVSKHALDRAMQNDSTLKEQIKMAEVIAEALGVDIKLFNSFDKKTWHGTENGSYNAATNTIMLDINAGKTAANDFTSGLLAVCGHELTHWMETFAFEAYGKYKDAVVQYIVQAYGKDGLNKLIHEQQERNQNLSRDEAIDEIVADASMDRMGDKSFWQAVAENLGEDRVEVRGKIAQFFDKYLSKIKEALRTKQVFMSRVNVARLEKQMQDALSALYAEGIREAAKNRKALTGTATETKNAATHAAPSVKTSNKNNELFSMRSPVEQTDRLIAWHNMSEEALRSALELGGLAMPSWAIKTADKAHTSYGDISVIAPRSLVDPKMNRNSMIFGGDAWTPVFPDVNYKISSDAVDALTDEIERLIGKDALRDLGGAALDETNIADQFSKHGGAVSNYYKRNQALRYAYLKSIGQDIELPKTAKRLDDSGKYENDAVENFASRLVNGKKSLDYYRSMTGKEIMQDQDLKNAITDTMVTMYGEEVRDAYAPEELSFRDIDAMLYAANKYFTEGIRKEIDSRAVGKEIDKVIDEAAYEKWIGDKLNATIERKGIRNNKDLFTPSGKRRSFDELNYAYNLANIVKAMKAQPKQGRTQFLSGPGSVKGAALKNYSTVEQVRADRGRLVNTAEEGKAAYDAYNDKLADILDRMSKTGDRFDTADALIEILQHAKTEDAIYRYMERELKDWYNVSRELAHDIYKLIGQINELPMEYFEGKTYDAVSFDETAAVVVPDTISADLKQQLIDAGANVIEYKAGDNEDRLAKVNSAENVQFSTRDTSLPSDLDLALSAADEIVAGGGDEYWASLLESDPGIAGEAEEIKRLGKQLKKTEADLAEARRNLTLTDRKLKTRGIATLAATIMQDQKAGDVNHNDVQKRITAVLTEAYQKALDQLDAGADVSDAWETVYQEGVVKAADILLSDATYAEKHGYGWLKTSLGQYLGEGAREYVEADIAARVAQDFDANRYRPGQKATVADRLVAQAENRVSKKLDAAKTENAALKAENAKLSDDKAFYKEQADTAKATAGELYQQLLDKREELKSNKKISADERKATLKKLDNMTRQMQAKRREAEVWKSKSEIGWKAANQAIREKEAAVAKLEKQLQREQNILSGKLKPPAIQKMLKAAREREAERVAQHKDEVFARYKERKNETALRSRIKNLHDEMNRDLLKPREGHFVPQSLIRPVVELLDMVNTQTKRAKSESAQAKIDAINAAYDRIKNDERYSQYYDETVKEMLTELSATLEGRSIYELSYAELEDVYTVMKAMRTTIRNSIKADLIEKGKEVWEIGNALRQELRAGKGASPLLLEKYHMAMLSAERAFHRFGGYQQNSAWDKTYRMLDNAQLKMLMLEMQATRLFDSVLLDKADFKQAEALTSYDKKDLVDVGLKDENGNAVPITRGMMLSLYMHLQNEENTRHLMYGGLTLPDFRRYYKGQENAWGKGSVSIPALGARVANLNELLDTVGEAGVAAQYEAEQQAMREMWESVRGAIEDQLSEYDRKWIAASKDFFDNFSRRELNRVTNEMYGFSKAKVDNYFPIVTDRNFLKTEFDSIAKNISLENAGFMKERVKAGNPILLEDITKAVNRQISNVSRYAGLTQALKTFNNVYNVQLKGFTDSVKKAMAQTFEDTGKKYIENLITDMIGGRTQPGSIFDRIKGNYAQAVLSANLSVTIKQAASFPTAAATVGWKPLLKALAKGGKNGRIISRADRSLIDTYSPLLWKRAQGAIDTEIGDMAHAQDWTKKAKWLMGWIEKTDIATVGRLWYAAEYYVKENFKGLERGNEAQIKAGESPFYQKVADVFNQIVEDTQPNYTVLQRPDILRNPNKLVRAMTMFSTQRFQNANILLDAAGEYNAMRRYNKQSNTAESKAALKLSKQKLTRAISSQVISAVVLNAMTLVAAALMHRMNPWRDDDDELTAESILEETLNGFLSTMAGSFLAGSELYEAISSMLTGSKYYGNDVGGISTINEFATAVVQFGQQAVKLIGDENSKPEDWTKLAEKQLAKVGQYLAQMTGIPVANVNKIIAGGKNHVMDALNGKFFSFEAGVERSAAVNANRYLKAWIAEDDAKLETVKAEMMGNYAEAGKDEEEANKALKTKLTATAKDAFVAGTLDKADAILFLVDTGYYDEDEAWNKVRQWEAENEHAGDEEYKWNQYEDLRAAFDTGTGIEEAIQELEDHGYSDTQLANEISDNIRDALNTGAISEETAIDYLKRYRGMDEDKAWKKVQEWQAKAEHADDEDYSYSQYDAIDAAIDANKEIKDLVAELTAHGVKAESITSHVKQHLVENYVNGNVSETALKNQLSRYCGIIAKDDVDKIVNDANCRKATGYAYSELDEAYRAGEVSKTTMKNALVKYGGKTSAEADKKIRWWDLQASKPSLEISESAANAWYDGTTKSRENGHESAKAAGMSIESYLKAKATLDAIKDSNDNGTGEDEVIAAIAKMNLTARQKDALYYERYKGGARKGIYKTW